MRVRSVVVMLCAVGLLSSCSTKTTLVRDSDTPLTADQKAIEAIIRADLKAENGKDGKAFVALWTDKGLRTYDQGSREEILRGKHNLGQDQITVVAMAPAKITGAAATITVDARTGENPVALPIFRVSFGLIKTAQAWLLDDFKFLGSPPAGDAKLVEIKAIDYAFDMPESLPKHVAFTFKNTGKEQHEISLYRSDKRVNAEDAKAALEKVDGGDLKDIPAGYKVQHLSFAQAGESLPITFAEPLKAGTYIFTCYIPQGGFGDNGPVNPNGKPHIQLGMIKVVEVS